MSPRLEEENIINMEERRKDAERRKEERIKKMAGRIAEIFDDAERADKFEKELTKAIEEDDPDYLKSVK